MTEEPQSNLDRAVEMGQKAKSVWELGAWIIAAGSTIAAFISGVGGVVQFLVEVAFFGFAAYIALILVVGPILLALEKVESATGRETTDEASIVILSVLGVAGAAFVRFVVFHDNVTQDLDAIGTAFGVVVGVAILMIPVFIWWYQKGSRPLSKAVE